MTAPVDAHALAEAVRARDRAAIGRAITWVESALPKHRPRAVELLALLAPHAGGAWRVAVSGPPGVGKSTFIENLGTRLCEAGRRVAVLAVDPSSERSGGSILGDKTRMNTLAAHPRAFVRPSPCGGWLGGVARGTREAIVVVEAAGYDVVFVETVGVGQSETQAASLTDFFLLLALPDSGDELQGIKRGIVELADAIAVNKADGDGAGRAGMTLAEHAGALRLLGHREDGWQPVALACSAMTGEGVQAVWDVVTRHRESLLAGGRLADKRRRQAVRALEQTLDALVRERFFSREGVREALEQARASVLAGEVLPAAAAEHIARLGFAEHTGPAQNFSL